MTNHKVKYVDLSHTVKAMGRQIEDSLDYASGFVPAGMTPSALFAMLKTLTTYKNDPPGV